MISIKEFEKKIGKTVDNITEAEFYNLFKDEKLVETFLKFPDFRLDLIDRLMYRNEGNDFAKDLLTLRYETELEQDEKILDVTFTNYRENKITRDELLEKMENYKNSLDPIFVISTFICSLLVLDDVDLKKDIEKINMNIGRIKMIFDEIPKNEKSLDLRCNLIDLLYYLRTRFFESYGIVLDVSWVDNEVDIIDEYLSKKLNRELPEINIKPEELGFIDITKLNKE